MNKKLIFRVASSGLLMASLGGSSAFAASASIGTTGPWSNNQINLSNWSGSWVTNSNWVGVYNVNWQGASSGNTTTSDNTSVWGGGGSGNAGNSNNTNTQVNVSNPAMTFDTGGGSGSDDTASINLTGPGSNNQIWIDNSSNFSQNNTNNVGVTNDNDQSATSGNVDVSDNTTVGGGVSSGNAGNSNQTTTNVDVSSPATVMPAGTTGDSSSDVSIGTTGPHSNNSVSITNSSNTSVNNTNNIGVENVNEQSAHSGNVRVSDNTTVGGGVSSGNAGNSNSTGTGVNVQ